MRNTSRHRVGVVPNPADCWQPRAAAGELEQIPGNDHEKARLQILTGLGGVGKTQLAARLARAAWDSLAVDLLVWITADSIDAIVSGYARAGAAVAGADLHDSTVAADRFLAWLAEQGDRASWLIVLDDLKDPAHFTRLWPPSTSSGRVVITTRRSDAALRARGQAIKVEPFTPKEATAYLLAKLADDVPPIEDATGLADDLGYLPLALAQAAAYIIDRGITVSDYRKRFAHQSRQLEELLPEAEALPDDYPASVAVTWLLSIQAADRLQPARLASPLLRALSLLDPNGAPTRILASPEVLMLLTGERRTEDPQALTVDEATARDGLHCLYRLSLASPGGSSLVPTVRIHALVQRAVRDRASREWVAKEARIMADGLLGMWPDVERDVELGQVMRANGNALQVNAGEALCRPSVHPVLFRVGRSLGEVGQLDAAIAFFKDLAATCSLLLGSDHAHSMAARHQLARWQGQAGGLASAAAAFQALLVDRLQALGPDHPDTLTTRHEIVHWRGQAGEPSYAVTSARELLTDLLRVLGPDHPETLATRHEIAHWQGHAGDPAGAAAAFQELLADRTRILGKNHPDTLTTRHEIAYWRGYAGDPVGASGAFQELLIDRLRVLGPHHPQTLTTVSNIAYWRGQSGDAAGAVTAFETLLANRLRVLGSNHPDTLTTRHNLARWQGQAGEPLGATAALRELLVVRLTVLGANHPHTLATRHELAHWQGRAGDLTEALAAFQELLADRLRVLGPDHPRTLATRHEIAYWQGEAGDVGGATVAFQAVLEDRLRVLGPNHPQTLATRHEIAHWQGRAGDAAGAVITLARLLTDRLKVLGPDHAQTRVTRDELVYWKALAAGDWGAMPLPALPDRIRYRL